MHFLAEPHLSGFWRYGAGNQCHKPLLSHCLTTVFPKPRKVRTWYVSSKKVHFIPEFFPRVACAHHLLGQFAQMSGTEAAHQVEGPRRRHQDQPRTPEPLQVYLQVSVSCCCCDTTASHHHPPSIFRTGETSGIDSYVRKRYALFTYYNFKTATRVLVRSVQLLPKNHSPNRHKALMPASVLFRYNTWNIYI